jgi:hypothetical protein
MEHETLTADYLIVGAGLLGLAFADTLIAESNANVIIVDRNARPGGHWNDAYPFVRLHLPSAFYGVSSRHLGTDRLVTTGTNAGLYENASAPEILSYFDKVMEETLLPSGRVRYLPMSDYQGDLEQDHKVVSRLSGRTVRVRANKVVDATTTDTRVPATHAPSFRVDPARRCVAINELVKLAAAYERYVIIGAGKTAIDACIWLLEQGVASERIRWIKPREAWLQNRAHIQPGEESLGIVASFGDMAEAAAQAESIDDLFARLEAARVLMRVDQTVTPTMYHCATISEGELLLLRQIKDVVRLGHVTRIEIDQIVLERGSVPTRDGELYVHCSSAGIKRGPAVPVFTDTRITLQAVRWCSPAISAALIAHLEATRSDVSVKNTFCAPLPYPDRATDFIPVLLGHMINDFLCRSDAELRAWMVRCRLNPGSVVAAHAKPKEEPWKRALDRMREHGQAAVAKLQRFAEQLG